MISRKYAWNYSQHIVQIDNSDNLRLVCNTEIVLEPIQADDCDYVAMLDGEDYWCDKHKQQKPLGYLKSHEDYVF